MTTIRSLVAALSLAAGPALAQSTSSLHNFEEVDGAFPLSISIDGGGTIYGTTETSGPGKSHGYCASTAGGSGCGTVFRLNGDGSVSVLVAFNGLNGATPRSPLVIRHGNIFGTTSVGGPDADGSTGLGIVFTVRTDGTAFRILHTFQSYANGFYPDGTIAITSDDTIFGTTSGYTTRSGAVIFKLSQSGAYSIVHRFSAASVTEPQGVIADAAGNIFGTTWGGSTTVGCGTIFEYGPTSGLFTTVANLDNENGCSPVFAGSDRLGNLYGYTLTGDAVGFQSTLFSLRKTGTGYRFQTLWTSSPLSNVYVSGLTVTPKEGLVGVTAPDGYGPDGVDGTLFKFEAGTFSTIYSITDETMGLDPVGAPVVTRDGAIISAALYGGDLSCSIEPGCGTVFRKTP